MPGDLITSSGNQKACKRARGPYLRKARASGEIWQVKYLISQPGRRGVNGLESDENE